MALATLAALEERLGITGTNPANLPDAYLTLCLSRAEAKVVAVIGREVAQAAFTEYIDGDGSPYLNLRRGPVASSPAVVLSTVTYDSARSETLSTVAAGDYFVHGDDANWKLPGYLEAYGYNFTVGQRNYKAVYTAGWATIPEDLVQIGLDVAVWQVNKRKDVGTGGRDIGDGGMSFHTEAELDAHLRVLLAPYTDARVL